ncbi:cytochrome c biogenesis protein ResB [Ectothiorhodospira variabilis]|uniref:cytochrome c biogenesis protein ResB n=1 Tax=Ectothiorhodospira variabilis TaxID=505694 RepID=UPI001EFC1AF9|nr:cytochrome c biogenesis protein ResB [Ectothiorhodospira variabilis]MCG5494733.1 cytochrome c biogenesis protein ResB [Ectothiorhodospira variabilis]MCG5503503.1 cytochrome c biogenesis protein ResB [Ectothiorhodospira variabilis]MCG5506782.1 cytochrome c biogenesis protein ResB [Ectothiorhodospira variabilis]
MNRSSQDSASPRHPSRLSILVSFLGSMNLAITLLVILAVASVVGTVLEQNQPFQNYLMNFGPFWHELFRTLNLYNVYAAGWFLFVLAFLVVSTAVCIYRTTPTMLRDMRNFRLNVREKSLRSFAHNVQSETHPEPPAQVLERAGNVLGARGYRVRQVEQADGTRLLSAMRGSGNRLGYFFTHGAIVIICVGGLIDGRVPLMLAEMTGNLVLETREIPASQVPEQSRLGPSNPSFRGSVEIPEGHSATVAFITIRDGYVVQDLPFRIEVKDFRVERHETGQERAFESDLVIHDDELDEPLARTISVNEPLIHRGYAIYQASFRDGGSFLNLNLHHLARGARDPLPLDTRVYGNHVQELTDGSRYTFEFTDLQTHNIGTVVDADGNAERRDMGPSLDYTIRDPSGSGMFFRAMKNPMERDGTRFVLTGVRHSTAEPFQYLYMPKDPGGDGVDRFMRMVSFLNDDQQVADVVADVATSAARQFQGTQGEVPLEVVETIMIRLMDLFVQGGYDAIVADIEQRAPQPQWESLMDLFGRVVNMTLREVYMRVLAEEGIESMTGVEAAYLDDALVALDALPHFGSDFLITFNDFEHVQASGLMITKAPGQNVVYFGSLMLIVGVFLMLYMSHRRCWLMVRPAGQGSQLVFAGTSNRNMLEFDEEFDTLSRHVLGQESPGDTTGHARESSENDPR